MGGFGYSEAPFFIVQDKNVTLGTNQKVDVMLAWIKKMFSEGDEVSSKRFVGIAGSVSLIATMVANSFTSLSIAPSDALVDAVLILSLGSLGLTSADKFAKRKAE